MAGSEGWMVMGAGSGAGALLRHCFHCDQGRNGPGAAVSEAIRIHDSE